MPELIEAAYRNGQFKVINTHERLTLGNPIENVIDGKDKQKKTQSTTPIDSTTGEYRLRQGMVNADGLQLEARKVCSQDFKLPRVP